MKPSHHLAGHTAQPQWHSNAEHPCPAYVQLSQVPIVLVSILIFIASSTAPAQAPAQVQAENIPGWDMSKVITSFFLTDYPSFLREIPSRTSRQSIPQVAFALRGEEGRIWPQVSPYQSGQEMSQWIQEVSAKSGLHVYLMNSLYVVGEKGRMPRLSVEKLSLEQLTRYRRKAPTLCSENLQPEEFADYVTKTAKAELALDVRFPKRFSSQSPVYYCRAHDLDFFQTAFVVGVLLDLDVSITGNTVTFHAHE